MRSKCPRSCKQEYCGCVYTYLRVSLPIRECRCLMARRLVIFNRVIVFLPWQSLISANQTNGAILTLVQVEPCKRNPERKKKVK